MNALTLLRFAAIPLLTAALVACPTAPDPGNPSGTAPAKPSSFVVSTATSTSVTLTWQLVSGATGYVLERKTAASAFAQIATPDAKTNSYTDSGLIVGTTYSYTLKAKNAVGSSDAATLDAVPSAGGADTDGDGISDADELAGYDVVISRGGTQISTRKVTSDPSKQDSDGDGLTDVQERTRFTDPTKADTDADGLSDNAEVSTWVSNPNDVDTDNDSNGNPALFDGNELSQYGTSPTLPDSDGDQYSDYKEIIELGGVFNPLIANTPRFEMSYDTAPSITVDIGQTGSTSVTSSKSSNLTLSNSASRSSTDTQTQRFNAEISATVGAEVSGGTGGFNATVSASVTATVGYGTENTKSYTNDSSQSTEKSAAEALEQSSVTGFELKGGKITLGMLLKNTSDVTFTLTNLGVTALRRDPANLNTFIPVGAMGFAPGTPTSFTLQTGEAAKSIALTLDIPGNLARELMQNPADLKFVFSSYDIQDANSRSFKFFNDTTNAQTALLVLDYGNGHSNRYRVATNVERTAGQIVGIRLGKVLTDTLKLGFETATPKGSTRVLKSLFDPTPGTAALITSSAADKTVWAVVGTNGLSITPTTNVDDIVLKAGSEVRVMLLRDVDGDKVLDSEEYFYGTSDNNADTDGDTISDYDETRTGWTVTLSGGNPRKVFSNPTTTNSDTDKLSDKQEQTAGTDPRSNDTDRDGTVDDADPQPLNPAVGANIVPVISNVTSSIVGSTVSFGATVTDNNLSTIVINWGDGTPTTSVPPTAGNPVTTFSRTHTYTSSSDYTITVTATDAGGLVGTATKAVSILDITSNLLAYYALNGDALDSSGNGKNGSRSSGCTFDDANRANTATAALRFNDNGGGAGCGTSQIGSIQTPFLAYSGSFSFSLWIKPVSNNDMWVFGQSSANGQVQWARFFLGQSQDAANGSTTVGTSSKASFIIPAAGGNSIIVTDPNVYSQTTWSHYAVTVQNSVGATTVKLYKNGVVVNTANKSFTYINPSITSPNLMGTGQNNNSSGQNLYFGLLDDVRIYGRALAANEVNALFTAPN